MSGSRWCGESPRHPLWCSLGYGQHNYRQGPDRISASPDMHIVARLVFATRNLLLPESAYLRALREELTRTAGQDAVDRAAFYATTLMERGLPVLFDLGIPAGSLTFCSMSGLDGCSSRGALHRISHPEALRRIEGDLRTTTDVKARPTLDCRSAVVQTPAARGMSRVRTWALHRNERVRPCGTSVI